MIPKTPFHIGLKEGTLEKTMCYIHSDTIFSAICNNYRLLYEKEELENLLRGFKDDPPFLISSAFPYSHDVLFFPTPKSIDVSKCVERRDIKRFKKIEFISQKVVEDLTENNLVEHLREDNIVQGKLLVSNEEKERIDDKIWIEREVPRVSIDRRSSSSNIYYFGEVEYCKECGLYFLVNFREDAYKNKLNAAIRLMGDEGVGGDRSYGKGLFTIEFKDFSWNIDSGSFVTLSLYFPREDEIEMVKNGYYEIIGRGGWVYSPDEKGTRKKFVRMLSEGSTFKGDKTYYGGVVKVGEGKHDVYRYGYAFPLYIGGV